MKKHIKKMYGHITEFIKNISEDNIGMYSAQASFFIIISAVPFIMLLLALAGFIVPLSHESIQNLISSYIPEKVAPLMNTVLSEILTNSSNISIISVTAITTLWLSSGGFMALHAGINKVFATEKRHNYIYRRAVSILYTLCFLGTLLFSLFLFVTGHHIISIINSHFWILSEISMYIWRLRIVIFILLMSLIFSLFYTALPHKKMKFSRQLPGAVFASVGWCVFSYAYSIYIDYFSNYSYVYGSLTAVVFLMLWLYFCMWIFLCGAEINKMLFIEKM